MSKRVLVCGATGFIGRNIAEALAKRDDFEVVGTYFRAEPLKHRAIRMVRTDLTNPVDVGRALEGVDIVIQAAATTSGSKDIVARPYIHVTDNAVMNSLIFRAAHEENVGHVVYFSCSVMYGSHERPVREEDFDANAEMHRNYFGVGWTKVYIEKMCEFYSRLGPTMYTVLRHSNVYGPYDKYDLERSHVFGATVTKVMSAPAGNEVVVWGSGDEHRDLLYVSDLVDFVLRAIDGQTESFELYNVGSENSIPVKQLVEKIVQRSGKRLGIRHDLSKPSIKTRLALDISRARARLGWSQLVTLDEGIKKTLDWYAENIGSKKGVV